MPNENIENPTPETPPAEPVAVPTEQPAPIDSSYPLYQGGGTSPISEPISTPPAETSPQPSPLQSGGQASQGEEQIPLTPFYQGGETMLSPIKNLLLKAKEMIQFRKRKKLEKILELARTKQKITNNDIQKLLRVSDATATRYLSQLVKEGRLKSESRRGGAFYQLL
ncbi:MAG: winged helix-turn-helix transcriptional regulator [Patescibacteria group bacterium]